MIPVSFEQKMMFAIPRSHFCHNLYLLVKESSETWPTCKTGRVCYLCMAFEQSLAGGGNV